MGLSIPEHATGFSERSHPHFTFVLFTEHTLNYLYARRRSVELESPSGRCEYSETSYTALLQALGQRHHRERLGFIKQFRDWRGQLRRASGALPRALLECQARAS